MIIFVALQWLLAAIVGIVRASRWLGEWLVNCVPGYMFMYTTKKEHAARKPRQATRYRLVFCFKSCPEFGYLSNVFLNVHFNHGVHILLN